MKLLPLLISTPFILAATFAGVAAGLGWPEAVGRLAGERSKAETCVALMKQYGNDAQISSGRLIYADAKASNDALVTGLVVALALEKTPASLPDLESQLKLGTMRLSEFCNSVSALLPTSSGNKGVLADIVTAAIDPLLESLSDGVGTLYNDYRDDDALTRKTIQTQLEAAKWPDFAEVKAAE